MSFEQRLGDRGEFVEIVARIRQGAQNLVPGI